MPQTHTPGNAKALKAMVEGRFHDRPFELPPLPMIWNSVVVSSKRIRPDLRRIRTEA